MNRKCIWLPAMIILLTVALTRSYGQDAAKTAHDKGVEAVKLEDQGNFDDALKLLDEAARLDPGNIDYPYEMTYCYYGQKQYQKVIDMLEKLKDDKQSFDRLYELLGNAYDMLSQTDKAIATYQDGLKKFPNSGVLYLEMGVIPLFKKDYDPAIKYFEKGIEVQPDFPSNYYWMARIYCNSGNKIWGMLYGELFMNLERNSRRTADISKLLYDTYKNSIVFSEGKTSVSFNKTTMLSLSDLKSDIKNGKAMKLPYSLVYEPNMALATTGETTVDLNSLDRIRTNFLKFYLEKFIKDYPNALFSYQDQVNQSGNFEAYNHWLLSKGDQPAFDTWKTANTDKWDKFLKWYTDNPIKLDENNHLNQSQY